MTPKEKSNGMPRANKYLNMRIRLEGTWHDLESNLTSAHEEKIFIMNASPFRGLLRAADEPMLQVPVQRVTGQTSQQVLDSLAIEEPLEIQITYGPRRLRGTRSISVTMRTPGNDFDLAAGFLMTEGVIRDANDIRQITDDGDSLSEDNPPAQVMGSLKLGSKQNVVRVELGTDVEVSVANLQ